MCVCVCVCVCVRVRNNVDHESDQCCCSIYAYSSKNHVPTLPPSTSPSPSPSPTASGFIMMLRPWLYALGTWILSPLVNAGQLTTELIVVMIVCPCVMNMVQFWIQDTFLKSDKGGATGRGRGRGRCCCCGLCVTCLHPSGRAAGGGGVLRIGRASSAAVVDEDGHTRDQGDGVGGVGGLGGGDGEGDAVSRDSAPTPAYGLQRETCCDRYED